MAGSSDDVKFMVFVKVRGGGALPYDIGKDKVVGHLLKEVYADVGLKEIVRLDMLKMYHSEQAHHKEEQARLGCNELLFVMVIAHVVIRMLIVKLLLYVLAVCNCFQARCHGHCSQHASCSESPFMCGWLLGFRV
jgi:hypothetical protein